MLYFVYFKEHFVMLRILKNYPQNAGNGISETPDFKIFRGSMQQTPLEGARAFSNRIDSAVTVA